MNYKIDSTIPQNLTLSVGDEVHQYQYKFINIIGNYFYHFGHIDDTPQRNKSGIFRIKNIK